MFAHRIGREDGLHLSKEQALCLRFAPSLPSKVTLTDGSYARYDYDAAGRKLKSYYHIGEDIVVGPGLDPVPFPSGLSGGDGLMSVGGEAQIAYLRDSIEYCGNVLYDNGHLDKVFVDGGYATLNATTGLPYI